MTGEPGHHMGRGCATLTALCLLLVVGGAQNAVAQETSPPASLSTAIKEDWRKAEFLGFPLALPVRFQFDTGQVLEVPNGYLWPRIIYTGWFHRKSDIANYISFTFWLSDRAPAINSSSRLETFSPEPGRSPSDARQYLVYVQEAEWDPEGKKIRPKVLLEKRRARHDTHAVRMMASGITEYRLTMSASKRTSVYYYYEDKSRQVLIDCAKFTALGEEMPSHCWLESYDATDDLRLSGFIPGHKIADWNAIVLSSETLLRSWVKNGV